MRRLAIAAAAAVLLSSCATQYPGTRAPGQPAPAPLFTAAPSETGMRSITVGDREMRYCGTDALDALPEAVDRVVFAVHGLDRNACGMLQAVRGALGDAEGVAIIAPRFSARSDVMASRLLVWDPQSWPQGDPSLDPGGVSSFAVLDALIERAGDRETVVVGFSGGGQFVNRYAATSPVGGDTHIVINPSSYLYFTPDRPGVDPAALASCPDYNTYRYGLAGLTGYAGQAGARAIVERYPTRRITYLIGTADDDPNSLSLDRSCPAQAQGPNREARALNYHEHLIQVFGPAIERRQPLLTVLGAGHDPAAMLNSEPGRAALQRAR